MKKIGILGGGQLALMMIPFIKSLGFKSVILDEKHSPCMDSADEFREGDFTNPSDCQKLDDCDVVTFEIENISLAGMQEIAKTTKVYPDPSVLELIQNKGSQKTFLKQNHIITSDFYVSTLNEQTDLNNKVIKLTVGGYDGKGVWIPKPGQSINEHFLNKECLIEDRINIDKEIAVVCCRSINGEIVTYDPVEMVMNSDLNLLDYQFNPATIGEEVQTRASDIATKILSLLDYVGTLAIEFFVDTDGELWVNELAPRVHNSGHNTLESAPCSQFENHIRAISGLPLGPSKPSKPSLTMNLLGSGEAGPTKTEINDELAENIHVHLYNKKESRPGRKMGHVTVLGNIKDLIQNKTNIKDQITISGEQK